MRTAGILLLSLVPVLFGNEYKLSLKKRVNFFNAFRDFIIFVNEQIRFFARERDELFILAVNDPRFNLPIFNSIKNCLEKGQDLTKMLKNYTDIRLNEQEINLISAFVLNIGKSDTEGQLSHCDFYKAQIEGLLKKTEAAYSVKGRLTTSLSASLAAVLFILMI